MTRRSIATTAALLGLGLAGLAGGLAGTAQAGQITLAAGNPGDYAFTGNGAGSLSVSSAGSGGAALFGAGDLGNYTLGPTAFVAGPLSGGNFPAGGSQAFAYLGNDGDSLTGTIGWTLVKDDSPAPDLIGTLAIGAVAGDAAFTAAFSGPAAAIDLVLEGLSRGVFLGALAATGDSETAAVSSGEAVGTVAVAEPPSLALLGLGLLGLGFVGRRRAPPV